MNIDNLFRNIRVLWRADAIIAQMQLQHQLTGLGLRALAALIAAFGLLMLELAAYFALVQTWSAIVAAIVLAAVNFAIALIIILIAARRKSGRDMELALDLHKSAMAALQSDAAGAPGELRLGAKRVHASSGFHPCRACRSRGRLADKDPKSRDYGTLLDAAAWRSVMKMMVLHEIGKPLTLEERPLPRPGSGEVLVRVEACAVCRTDLHVVDGELPNPKLPSYPATRLSALSRRSGMGAPVLQSAHASAFHGLDTPAAAVLIASRIGRTSATIRFSPAIRETAALPLMWWRMPPTPSRSRASTIPSP